MYLFEEFCNSLTNYFGQLLRVSYYIIIQIKELIRKYICVMWRMRLYINFGTVMGIFFTRLLKCKIAVYQYTLHN